MAERKGGIGAWDLMQRLQNDPEWVVQDAARRANHESMVQKQKEEVKPEEDPILAELASLGYVIESVWDLVNTRGSYASAIPILLKFLPLVRHPVLLNGLARALTVKEARGLAGEPILALLRQERDSELRWVLANALTVVADKGNAAAVKALLDDPAYADVSERLGKTLKRLQGKSKKEKS
jgi:hypothetical protein